MGRKGKVALGIGIGVGALVLLLAIAGGIYAWRFASGSKKITVRDVDISTVPDGEFRGEFKFFHVSAVVEVTVEDGRMTDIAIVKGDANRAHMETAVQKVIDRQTLEVDTVSGATVSTKAVLKAIENALTGGSQ